MRAPTVLVLGAFLLLAGGPARGQDDAPHATAFEAALSWLAAHQDEDGTLDADAFDRHCPEDDRCEGRGGGHHGERVPCVFDGATTALAVLAWSRGGSTREAGPHAAAIARALPGLRARIRRPPSGFDDIWNHAYATQAVAEVAGRTEDPSLAKDLARAVAHLLARQLADGGWSYVYAIGDVPTTSAVLIALGAAKAAGVEVEPERLDRALAFLDARLDAGSGRTEYHEGAEQKGYTPTTANTAAVLAARAALDRLDGAPRLGRQLAVLSRQKPRWKLEFREVKTPDGRTIRAQVGDLYPYAWYLTTLALEHRGGRAWTTWRGRLRRALLDGQAKEGHARGSWEPLGPYSTSGGRVFVTALGALMLRNP